MQDKENGFSICTQAQAYDTEAEEALDKLKERLLGQLGLFLPDLDKGFVMRTDAWDYAMGAFLEQVRCD